jgi:hypothetical protein
MLRLYVLLKTYLECSKEFVEVDGTVLVSIKVGENLQCFILTNINSEVNESPTEIVNIKVFVSLIVHGFKYSCDTSDAKGGSLQNLLFDVVYEVINVEFLEIFNGFIVGSIWGRMNQENVLALLEFGGDIRRKSSLVF